MNSLSLILAFVEKLRVAVDHIIHYGNNNMDVIMVVSLFFKILNKSNFSSFRAMAKRSFNPELERYKTMFSRTLDILTEIVEEGSHVDVPRGSGFVDKEYVGSLFKQFPVDWVIPQALPIWNTLIA
jgi:hypothetical protein